MTDRHAGYIVVLGTDIREDDAEAIISALRMVKGVVAVDPIISEAALHIAQRRADDEWRKRIYDLLDR